MSRHPDNPYWCQDHDQPIVIGTREEWEAAQASGHITPEHIFVRTEGILEHEFSKPAGVAYDEDGFIAALVADGWRAGNGITVQMHPHDHPPPHVHVRFPQRPDLRLRLALDTGEPLDGRVPDGWAKKLRRVSDFVTSSRDVLMPRWIEMRASAL